MPLTVPPLSGAVDHDDAETLIGTLAPSGGTPPYSFVLLGPERLALPTLAEAGPDALAASLAALLAASGAWAGPGGDVGAGLLAVQLSVVGQLNEAAEAGVLVGGGAVWVSPGGALHGPGGDVLAGSMLADTIEAGAALVGPVDVLAAGLRLFLAQHDGLALIDGFVMGDAGALHDDASHDALFVSVLPPRRHVGHWTARRYEAMIAARLHEGMFP